jgi:hypothetical protein
MSTLFDGGKAAMPHLHGRHFPDGMAFKQVSM